MIVKDRKKFTTGLIAMLGFIGVLVLMFLPLYGPYKENFLAYADRVFNSFAKGSAYFIPKLRGEVDRFVGWRFDVEIDIKRPTDRPEDTMQRVELCKHLYGVAGASVEVKDMGKIRIVGDLGQVLKSALEDSEAMYWNRGEFIKEKYGVEDYKRMFRQWHTTLTAMEKKLTFERKVEEARVIKTVVTKAIEPAYNFYGISPQRIKESPWLISGLLVFYVIYTVWYGYAVLYLFEGLGLSTKKPKVKKEV